MKKVMTALVAQRKRTPTSKRDREENDESSGFLTFQVHELGSVPIPSRVLRELKHCDGCVVDRSMGLNLVCISSVECAGYHRFLKFSASVSDDAEPLLSITNIHSMEVYDEACTIVDTYQSLTRSDLTTTDAAGLPVLPPPRVRPFPLARYLHANVSLSAVVSRIANPSSALYPAISALPPGQFICTLLQGWKGSTVEINIHKQ